MNAVVIVFTVEGRQHTYLGDTLASALYWAFHEMDAVCAEPASIASIELFTRFAVNPADSKLFDDLKARGLADKLKQ